MTMLPSITRRAAALATAALGIGAYALVAVSSAESRPVAAGAAKPTVLVELFTSQGCSSCPPADDLAARLAREPGVLVVSRPVTYWDRLGWKDTLARPANTELQQAYARRGFDGNGVYTPQIVVDGRSAAVGSQEQAVRALIAQSAHAAKPRLALARTDGTASVTIQGDKGTGEVMLLTLRPHVTVGIGSGENGGRRVTYTNIVKGERRLGTWSGGPARFAIPADVDAGAPDTSYAVVLRTSAGGPVLAAEPLRF